MPEPTPPKPLSISDEQLTFLLTLVEPLHPSDRSRFLLDLAATLRHELQPLGDGILHRKAREVFAKYFRAPQIPIEQAPRPRASALKAAPPIG
jgi:hypothetical protein